MREEEGLSARTVIQAKKEWTGCVPHWAGANRAHATLNGTVLVQGAGWWQNWAWGCKNWPVGTRVGDMVTD